MPFGILRFLHLNLERSPRTPQRINPNHEAELRFCVCFFRDSSGVRGFCPPMCANSPICTVACTNVPFILKFRHYVFGENASEKKRAQPKAGTWAPKNGKNKWPKRQERCAMHTQRTQDAATANQPARSGSCQICQVVSNTRGWQLPAQGAARNKHARLATASPRRKPGA